MASYQTRAIPFAETMIDHHGTGQDPPFRCANSPPALLPLDRDEVAARDPPAQVLDGVGVDLGLLTGPEARQVHRRLVESQLRHQLLILTGVSLIHRFRITMLPDAAAACPLIDNTSPAEKVPVIGISREPTAHSELWTTMFAV